MTVSPSRQVCYDIAIVGGGLCGGLLALRLQDRYPRRSIAVFERGASLGGQHTWSFQGGDIATTWLQPLISCSWQGYEVRFPHFTRSFDASYHSLRADDYHAFLSKHLRADVFLNTAASALSSSSITLASGGRLRARCVLDARGLGKPYRAAGWQKFLGLHVQTQDPHGVVSPILMDATVRQLDGYRFLYVLPWDATTLLIEDTRYSDTNDIDSAAYEEAIAAYAVSQGWQITRILSREQGALPLPLFGCEPPALSDQLSDQLSGNHGPLKVGTALGLAQPTTGYSLPAIVRMIDFICQQDFDTTADLAPALRRYGLKAWQDGTFFRRLNNMLFLAATAEERRGILSQFYSKSDDLIGRFYRGDITLRDRLALLSGKPPIGIWRGLQTFMREV